MKREDLIKKWLDNELSPEELKAFKQLEDHKDLVKLANGLKQFKAEDFDTDLELGRLNTTLKNKSKNTNNWVKPILRIAAILTICFGSYYYTTTLNTNAATLAAQKETIDLPDSSIVTINAESSISYNKNKWDEDREIELEGEAYFKVAKGSKFKVKTNNGIVTVLGTEFNVKDRNNYFEVTCYEGAVNVEYNSKSVVLKPGNSFLMINGEYIDKTDTSLKNPSWINNESHFTSIPLKNILLELERQYNVTITVNNIDEEQLFTGSFTHDDIDVALKAITLPLNLTYVKTNSMIILESE